MDDPNNNSSNIDAGSKRTHEHISTAPRKIYVSQDVMDRLQRPVEIGNLVAMDSREYQELSKKYASTLITDTMISNDAYLDQPELSAKQIVEKLSKNEINQLLENMVAPTNTNVVSANSQNFSKSHSNSTPNGARYPQNSSSLENGQNRNFQSTSTRHPQNDPDSPDERVEPREALNMFWSTQFDNISDMVKTPEHILKFPPLPLARIKKVMKMDENVKMISGEVPLIFAKAAELFILELTLRSWVHTEENRRRTLQRNDVAHAVTEHDMFDFLIDIVPRDEIQNYIDTNQQIQSAQLQQPRSAPRPQISRPPDNNERPQHAQYSAPTRDSTMPGTSSQSQGPSSISPRSSKMTEDEHMAYVHKVFEQLKRSGEAAKLTKNGTQSAIIQINGKKYRLEADQ